jgi:NitT/TauT family transport system substrate-binding protein
MQARGTFRYGLAAAVAATAMAVAATAAQAQPETKVIRFVGVPSAGSSVVWIARDKGFDKEEGIEIRPQADLAAGLVTDNILGGQAEMAYGGITTMLIPYSKGAPLVLVATTDYGTLWELLVHQDNPYQKLEDLKGKTISVIAPNTICVLALRRAFELNGWPKDFAKFTVVAPPDQVAAFGAKRVDASCMFDPMRTQMRSQFGGRAIWNILDPKYIVADSLGGGLMMHRDFVAKNPKAVAAIQRAIDKAARAANADPEVVYATLANATRQDVANLRKIALPKYASPPSIPEGVREMAELLYKYEFVTQPIDVTGFDRSPRSLPK